MQLKTRKQSYVTMVLGVLFILASIFTFFVVIGSHNSWSNIPFDWSGIILSFITFLIGIVFINLGNRDVIDLRYFHVFLKEYVKNEQNRER